MIVMSQGFCLSFSMTEIFLPWLLAWHVSQGPACVAVSKEPYTPIKYDCIVCLLYYLSLFQVQAPVWQGLVSLI